MKKSFWANVSAVPVNYPDVVVLEYRVLDPQSKAFTGEGYQSVEMTWTEALDHSRPINAYDRGVIEGYLSAGQKAYMGEHHVMDVEVLDGPAELS